MEFEDCLYAELTTVPDIGKVFPLNVIEGTKAPFCVYESSDGLQEKTLSGYVASKEIHGKIYVVQTSYSLMKSVSNAVINQLQSFQSRIIGGTSGIYVLDVSYEKVTELYDPQLFLYQSEIDFTVRI